MSLMEETSGFADLKAGLIQHVGAGLLLFVAFAADAMGEQLPGFGAADSGRRAPRLTLTSRSANAECGRRAGDRAQAITIAFEHAKRQRIDQLRVHRSVVGTSNPPSPAESPAAFGSRHASFPVSRFAGEQSHPNRGWRKWTIWLGPLWVEIR